MTSVTEVFRSRDKLGEVPVWDVAEQALYWVDIESKRLRRWDYVSGAVREWYFPERIGSFALREKGGLVCAFESGLAFFDPATKTSTGSPDPKRTSPPTASTTANATARADSGPARWTTTSRTTAPRFIGSIPTCR
ncbi:SMP-30/gluconolactonase/LRE family protein [Mesorhizobium sp. Cs1330R2N1]|jgi:sugar lactone lactonase YvrE|uniref:SMP-30/gluconolactonase/LRE family protein n=1 Tax=Mesorhizobium argentiipisi TaxID=3015175 RepID=A0ABU8K5V9_9HYPH